MVWDVLAVGIDRMGVDRCARWVCCSLPVAAPASVPRTRCTHKLLAELRRRAAVAPQPRPPPRRRASSTTSSSPAPPSTEAASLDSGNGPGRAQRRVGHRPGVVAAARRRRGPRRRRRRHRRRPRRPAVRAAGGMARRRRRARRSAGSSSPPTTGEWGPNPVRIAARTGRSCRPTATRALALCYGGYETMSARWPA